MKRAPEAPRTAPTAGSAPEISRFRTQPHHRRSQESWTQQQVWFRAKEPLPDDPLLHVCIAAYASDLTLLVAALLPHGRRPNGLQMASLDHAMWFHRPFRADDWLLYDQGTPSTSGGRGLAVGYLYNRSGDLVVSVMQEGLMRPRDPSRG